MPFERQSWVLPQKPPQELQKRKHMKDLLFGRGLPSMQVAGDTFPLGGFL